MHGLTIKEAQKKLQNKEITSVQLTEAIFTQIEKNVDIIQINSLCVSI